LKNLSNSEAIRSALVNQNHWCSSILLSPIPFCIENESSCKLAFMQNALPRLPSGFWLWRVWSGHNSK